MASRALRRLAGFALAAHALLGISAFADERAPLALARTLPLAGVRGRIDHLAFDADGQRLFVAALGNDSVEVLGAQRGERLASLAVERPTAVVLLGAAARIAVASGGSGELLLFDAASYAPRARLGGFEDADNLRLDPREQLLYLGFAEGALARIDPRGPKLLGRTSLPSHPEAFALAADGSAAFVNLPGSRSIAVWGRNESALRARWPTGDLSGNYPIALDETGRRVLVGFREPPRLVAFDADSGRELGRIASCGDSDDLFYDAAGERVFVVCGEGAVDWIAAPRGSALRVVERIATRAGARTGLLSPATRELFVALPAREALPAEIRVYRIAP